MEITILAFGQLAEIIGKTCWQTTYIANTDLLKIQLEKEHPALASTTYKMAVNKKIFTENTTIATGAVIALLPPFSGG